MKVKEYYNHDDPINSGTISLHEQTFGPTATADYGKIYVKPFSRKMLSYNKLISALISLKNNLTFKYLSKL